ncbi:DUF1178 family protein [Rhodosalinus sp. K401]|uniref:DUF1178 family protein n=1 Tax=Rhodosalinus sp. K401 TaxID=3239195 RepID=UPI0035246270
MIHYTLKCANDHSFDSWFQSAVAFDKLEAAGMVCCSVCGSTKVQKDVMSPRVGKTTRRARPAPALSAPAHPAEPALRRLRAFVEANSEDVGENFVREARAIHAGDAPERAIRGQARPAEARKLVEDGVPVAPLPFLPTRKSN